MKEKYNSISPFFQVVLLFAIGTIAFIVISMFTSVIIGFLYPEIPTQDTNALLVSYPVQYMFIHFLPFQLGFLLVPGLIYIALKEKKEEKVVKKTELRFVVWSILLFIVAFFLLPFFSEINLRIIDFFGYKDILTLEKEASDQQLTQLIGNFGSLSFYMSLLFIGLITGIAEELAFRRFVMHHILINTQKLGWSVFASAGIFALLHFNYIQIIPLFIFGLALGMMYYVSGSIVPGIIVHALNNILNIYWLSTNSFPSWMSEIDLKTTIPSTLLLMGLIFYFLNRIK